MMTRQEVVRAIRLLAAMGTDTNSAKLVELLQKLADEVEKTDQPPPTPVKRTNGEEMLPANDERVAGMLSELRTLVGSGLLSKKDVWFPTQYLQHRNFSVKGVQKVLATAKAAAQIVCHEDTDNDYCNPLA